jgi:hypothetical protein
MNEEQINVKIAELCGWKLRQEIDGEFSLIDPFGEKVSADWEPNTTLDSFYYALPSYCTDLNAMHQAEGTMSLEQWDSYITELYRIAQLPHICHFTHEIAFIHATAKQRAIAFLKTKGVQTTE